MKFSLYENGILNVYPSKSIDVLELLAIVMDGNPIIEQVRKAENQALRDTLKKNLSYVTIAGEFEKRSNKCLIKSSGLACMDLDHLSNLEEMKEELSKDDYIHAIFISPSGDGLKVLVRIPEVKDNLEYKKYWVSISEYLNLPESDEGTKDIARACYLSVDEAPYYNPDSKVYTQQSENVSSKAKQVIKDYNPKQRDSEDFLDKILSCVSMEQVLSHFGADTTLNPTNCPFHHCSQRCLSFTSEVAFCHDTDCSGDNSWNVLSFVKKANNCDAAEAIKWLAEFAGLEKEYEESKKAYFESLEQSLEPRGWACSINIRKMAERYNFTKCHLCDTPLSFNEVVGWYKCDSCGIKGGLKQFAELISKRPEKIQ